MIYNSSTNITSCKPCDGSTSICLGGNQIVPKEGFARTNLSSEEVIQCPQPSQCTGGVENYGNKLFGNCSTGSEGILCMECKKNYFL